MVWVLLEVGCGVVGCYLRWSIVWDDVGCYLRWSMVWCGMGCYLR